MIDADAMPSSLDPARTRPDRRSPALVFGLFACLYLLTSPGRMGSMDAYTQLQSSVQLVRTGSAGTADQSLYGYAAIPSPDGRYFQAHDPGNLLLFLPAAVVASLSGGDDPARTVPLPGRVAASLTYALAGAACLTAIFLGLRSCVDRRQALAVTLAAGVATPLWIYARGTMDVLPAALGLAAALAVLLTTARDDVRTDRSAVSTALAVAFAGWFRTSVLPFFAVAGLVALVWGQPRWARLGALFSTTLAVGVVPILVYNYLRTGNPLVLGTMMPQYLDQNGFNGNVAAGLYGLLVSPNHGLLIFAPWLLLGLVPQAFTGVPRQQRVVVTAFLVGSLAYTMVIAGLHQWAKVEWGPRYLVPVLPAVILPAALAASRLWSRRHRVVVAVLVVASFVLTVPAAVVNYSYVVTDYPGAADPLSAQPRQIIGTYAALARGLRGEDMPAPAALRADPERAAGLHFPDLLVARLVERGGMVQLAGWAMLVLLLTGLRWCAREAWR